MLSGLVAQSCPTLCNFMDRSPPFSSVHGISQAGMAFFPSGDFSNPEVELTSPVSPALQVASLPAELACA